MDARSRVIRRGETDRHGVLWSVVVVGGGGESMDTALLLGGGRRHVRLLLPCLLHLRADPLRYRLQLPRLQPSDPQRRLEARLPPPRSDFLRQDLVFLLRPPERWSCNFFIAAVVVAVGIGWHGGQGDGGGVLRQGGEGAYGVLRGRLDGLPGGASVGKGEGRGAASGGDAEDDAEPVEEGQCGAPAGGVGGAAPRRVPPRHRQVEETVRGGGWGSVQRPPRLLNKTHYCNLLFKHLNLKLFGVAVMLEHLNVEQMKIKELLDVA